jgi:L-ascorbate metabolism protein UlaG (beta-lactamase superfamily)
MVIEWLGHSCFTVTLKNGKKVLFDPYDSTVGYPPTKIEADIVIISHAHFDHNDLSRVKGKYTVVEKEGLHSFDNFKIEGIKTWHDNEQGSLRGENIVFLLKAEGLSLCHMGDIGCLPSEEVYEKLSGIDILLIPVGGNYTIDAEQALNVCARISPNIIIPMHFKTSFTDMKIAPVEGFLELAGREYDVSHPGKCRIEIDKATLKKRTRIVVMECM